MDIIGTHIDIESLPRQWYFLSTPSLAALPDALNAPSPHFGLALIFEYAEESVQTIADMAELAMHRGAAAFMIWGPNSEFVHDVIDEVSAERSLTADTMTHIVTTWHNDDLNYAVEDIILTAFVDPSFATDDTCWLVVAIGQSPWPEKVLQAFKQYL